MGNLVDMFIIRLKPEYRETSIEVLLPHIQEPYHPMFTMLWNRYHSLEEILDIKNLDDIESMDFGSASSQLLFSHRYRGESLQQLLRQQFFDTLLIVQNVYAPDKEHIFHVVYPGQEMEISTLNLHLCENDNNEPAEWQMSFPVDDVISEEEWKSSKSADETFVDAVKTELENKGVKVHTLNPDNQK